MSGQNNSLVTEYKIFQENINFAVELATAGGTIEIEVIKLDDYVSKHFRPPAFVKIDVEDFELQALQGLRRTLETAQPALMMNI